MRSPSNISPLIFSVSLLMQLTHAPFYLCQYVPILSELLKLPLKNRKFCCYHMILWPRFQFSANDQQAMTFTIILHQEKSHDFCIHTHTHTNVQVHIYTRMQERETSMRKIYFCFTVCFVFPFRPAPLYLVCESSLLVLINNLKHPFFL